MAQWVTVLATQEGGPEFKSPVLTQQNSYEITGGDRNPWRPVGRPDWDMQHQQETPSQTRLKARTDTRGCPLTSTCDAHVVHPHPHSHAQTQTQIVHTHTQRFKKTKHQELAAVLHRASQALDPWLNTGLRSTCVCSMVPALLPRRPKGQHVQVITQQLHQSKRMLLAMFISAPQA